MIIKPTSLIYSAHNRGNYLHKEWIVNRALENRNNPTILYLPFSMDEHEDQVYSWSTFKWYFDQFAQQGLRAETFFWNDGVADQDVALLVEKIRSYEVVILGGGETFPGFENYGMVGIRAQSDYTLFEKLLQERTQKQLLTVGFSAGAMQMAGVCFDNTYHKPYNIVKNVTPLLHHEWGKEDELRQLGRSYPNSMAIGLPNDSGIACNEGTLPSGNTWQVLQFIIDNSWDRPEDSNHMKSRAGMRIEHFYADGRQWTFNGGDAMVRIFSPDKSFQGGWIIQPNNPNIYDYWTQYPSEFENLQDILESH